MLSLFSKKNNPKKIENSQEVIKILLIGHENAGKSAFLERFINGIFVSEKKITEITEFKSKQISYESEDYNLQFWDIAGELLSEDKTHLFNNYSQGAHLIIVCFDASDDNAKQQLEASINVIDNNIYLAGVPKIVIGCKYDVCQKDLTNINGILREKYNKQDIPFFISSALNEKISQFTGQFVGIGSDNFFIILAKLGSAYKASKLTQTHAGSVEESVVYESSRDVLSRVKSGSSSKFFSLLCCCARANDEESQAEHNSLLSH